jgi:hypothetical protein
MRYYLQHIISRKITNMFIQINEKLLDELKHTAEQLGKRKMGDADNDIRSAYLLLEAIVSSTEKGIESHPRVINREGHTHVILTSFCLSNEWLGDKA